MKKNRSNNNQIIISILLIASVIFGYLIYSKMASSNTNPPLTSKINDRTINATPLPEVQSQLAENPVIDPIYKFPQIETFPEEFNTIVSFIQLSDTKEDVMSVLSKERVGTTKLIDNGATYLLVDEANKGVGEFLFEFTQSNILVRTYYFPYSKDLSKSNFLQLLGKPQHIYTASPSNDVYEEYIYANKGFTALFLQDNLYEIVFYNPQSFEEYKSSYKNLNPTQIRL